MSTATPTATAPSSRRLGWILAGGGMLLVSFDSLFIRLAETDTWTIAFLFGICSTATLSAIGAFTRRRNAAAGRVEAGGARDPLPLALAVLLSAGAQLAFTAAVGNTAVSNVVAIVAAAPLATAGLAFVVLREHPSPKVLTAIVAVLAGVGIIVSGSLGSPTLDGDLLAVGAVSSFAGSVVVWRRHPDLDRPLALALGSATMALVALPFASLGDAPARAFLFVAMMGLLVNPSGRMAYSNAPRYAPAAEVALFAPVETVAATTWAWIAFDERPTTRTVIGGVVVLTAVLSATVGRPARTRPRARR